jgi:uncharacterized protein
MIAVHVAQLLKAPVGTQRSFEFSEPVPELATELGLRGPIEGQGKLVRTTHGILAQVQYRAEIEQECGRCLGAARTTIESEVSDEYLPSTNIHTGQPEMIVADVDEPRIREDHILDLTDLIRQDIVVEQPLRPLCQPECAGLCPQCGENLNEVQCTCADETSGDENGGLGRLGELLKQRLPPGA